MKVFIFIFTSLLFFSIASSVLAAQNTGPIPASGNGIGCGDGFGVIAEILCGTNSEDVVANTTNRVFSFVIGIMTVAGGMWFGFQILSAGMQWIGSGGDKHAIEIARNKITYGLLGLAVIVGSIVIMGLVGMLFGLDLINPGNALLNLF